MLYATVIIQVIVNTSKFTFFRHPMKLVWTLAPGSARAFKEPPTWALELASIVKDPATWECSEYTSSTTADTWPCDISRRLKKFYITARPHDPDAIKLAASSSSRSSTQELSSRDDEFIMNFLLDYNVAA